MVGARRRAGCGFTLTCEACKEALPTALVAFLAITDSQNINSRRTRSCWVQLFHGW